MDDLCKHGVHKLGSRACYNCVLEEVETLRTELTKRQAEVAGLRDRLKPFLGEFYRHRGVYAGEKASANWFEKMPGEWSMEVNATMKDCRDADRALEDTAQTAKAHDDKMAREGRATGEWYAWDKAADFVSDTEVPKREWSHFFRSKAKEAKAKAEQGGKDG